MARIALEARDPSLRSGRHPHLKNPSLHRRGEALLPPRQERKARASPSAASPTRRVAIGPMRRSMVGWSLPERPGGWGGEIIAAVVAIPKRKASEQGQRPDEGEEGKDFHTGSCLEIGAASLTGCYDECRMCPWPDATRRSGRGHANWG
jgi:hypothetical protein